MTDTLTIELPWAPSTNTWLRHFLLPGRKHVSTCISQKGRQFYADVGRILSDKQYPKLFGALAMTIELYPPNKRRIDVDNRNKPILDSLKRRPKDKKQFPGAWVFADDDSQVKDLRCIMREIYPGGKVVVTITKIPGVVQQELFGGEDESSEDEECPPPNGDF